jgi:hypothetical protein
VVDIALFSRDITSRRVRAMPVTHLDRAPECSGEEPLPDPDIDDA